MGAVELKAFAPRWEAIFSRPGVASPARGESGRGGHESDRSARVRVRGQAAKTDTWPAQRRWRVRHVETPRLCPHTSTR